MKASERQVKSFVEGWPRSRLHLPFPRHDRTAFVRFHLEQCIACGECAAACPRQVIGIIAIFGHRHAHVDRATDCKGCQRCVGACSRGVIRAQQAEGRSGTTHDTKRGPRC